MFSGGGGRGGGVARPPVFNVKDFGATGDGTTDDAARIQACIDAATDGAQVYFPAGTYIIGTTIQMKANCRYTGASRLRSILKMKSASNLHAVIASAAWAANTASSADGPIHVEHLRIDGNTSGQSSGNGHGIALNNYWSTLEHMYIHDTRGDGILLSSARQDGTETSSSVECMVFRCDVRQITGHGIHVYDPDPAVDQTISDGYIIGCKVETTTEHGIFIEASAGWSVSQNHVYGAKKSGIKCNRIYATSICDNYIESVGTSSTPGYYCQIDCQTGGASTVPTVISNNRGNQSMSGVSASSNMYGIYVLGSTGITSVLSVCGNSFTGATHANTSQGLVLECADSGATIRCHAVGNRMSGWDNNTRPILNSGTFTYVGDMFKGYQTLTYAASIQTNTHIGDVAGVTLTGNTTILNPFSAIAGEVMTWIFTQDATGGRTVTWDTAFKVNWSATTTANKINSITFAYNGTNWVQVATGLNL